MFLICLILGFSLSGVQAAGQMEKHWQTFSRASMIAEPSGVVQLDNGQILVAEDEKDGPMWLMNMDIDMDASPVDARIGRIRELEDLPFSVNDVEALSRDGLGNIYAITSHSYTRSGRKKATRYKFVRFRVVNGVVTQVQEISNLMQRLIEQHDLIRKTDKITDAKHGGGFVIEGLAVCPGDHYFYIGLRGPLLDGKALVIKIRNTPELFSPSKLNHRAGRIKSELIALDLQGEGIRDIAFDPVLGQFIIVAGSSLAESKPMSLWLWNGQRRAFLRPVKIRGLADFKNAEGITSVRLPTGRRKLMMVSDDGRGLFATANYIFIDYSHLMF